MNLSLVPFDLNFRSVVAGWPLDTQEARAWAGDAVSFPVSPAAFERWHVDGDIHPFGGLDRAGKLVAYGELWIEADHHEAELARIIVMPARRRSGVAMALVKALVIQAGSLGCSDLYLRVRPCNTAAIRCYRRSGFVRVTAAEARSYNAGQPVSYTWLRHQTR